MNGTILDHYKVEGSLHSVNADGMTSKNFAIYNKREVVMINSVSVGKVAFIAVGATCVGSIQMLYEIGDSVTKGNEMGYFQFGGSTVVLVFQKGQIEFATDIEFRSIHRVEALVEVGMDIAAK